jgi:hypothetical protein
MDQNKGILMVLQFILAMTHTNLDDYLLFGKRIIVRILRNHPLARVKIQAARRLKRIGR